jgi:outer membrane protein assembly factor BamB
MVAAKAMRADQRAAATLLYGVVRIPGTPTSCVLLLLALVAAAPVDGVFAQRSSLSQLERLKRDRPAPLFPLEPAWTTPLPAPPATGPAFDAARAYVGLADARLAAVDRDSGMLLWTVPAEVALVPAPADEVVVAAGTREVGAYAAGSGTRRWTGALDRPPAWLVVTGEVAVVAAGAQVQARAVATGELRWRVDLPGPARVPPAGAGEWLAVADESGGVSLLERATGRLVWQRTVPGRPGAVAMAADRVFVGTSMREFRALRVSDGATLWQWRTGGDVAGARADGNRVFVTTLDNLVRALDTASGNQQWKARLSTRPAGTPLLLPNLVVVSGVAPRVEGFARKAGATAGSVLPVAELLGGPAVAPGVEPYRVAMVVATRAGALQGYRPERMMFREPRSAPLTALPGRRLVPEPPAGPRRAPRLPAQP